MEYILSLSQFLQAFSVILFIISQLATHSRYWLRCAPRHIILTLPQCIHFQLCYMIILVKVGREGQISLTRVSYTDHSFPKSIGIFKLNSNSHDIGSGLWIHKRLMQFISTHWVLLGVAKVEEDWWHSPSAHTNGQIVSNTFSVNQPPIKTRMTPYCSNTMDALLHTSKRYYVTTNLP